MELENKPSIFSSPGKSARSLLGHDAVNPLQFS
jgi:hypothetical protein